MAAKPRVRELMSRQSGLSGTRQVVGKEAVLDAAQRWWECELVDEDAGGFLATEEWRNQIFGRKGQHSRKFAAAVRFSIALVQVAKS